MQPLTIGMPVYNGAETIERALRSLLDQTFAHFDLIVSDNASTDATAMIAEEIAKTDQRVRTIRHPQNLGATANFMSLVRSAKTTLFMWAACDDEWHPDYIAECKKILDADSSVGFSGGQVVSIDPRGTVLRTCRPFDGLDDPNASVRAARFASMREAAGKANLFYSIYRTPIIQAVCADDHIMDGWGSDMGLVTAVLSRTKYRAAETTLYKRVTSDSDIATSKALAAGDYRATQYDGGFPPDRFGAYLRTMTRGVQGAIPRTAVRGILLARRLSLFRWQIRQKAAGAKRRVGRLLSRA